MSREESRDPRYRFHGRHQPTRHAPILAEVPEDASKDSTVAVLRVYDPIDSWGGDWGISAKEFVTALDQLDDSVTEIRLHINSPGGEVFEGITIVNALRQHPARIVAVVDGLAASIASVIACAADEVVMAGNSTMMIHDASGICIGNAADMRDLADVLDKLSDNIAGVYASKAGGTTAEWRETMRGTQWYTAEEAVEAGLADSATDAPEQQPTAEFDLSIYDTTPPPAAAPVEPNQTTSETPSEAAPAPEARPQMSERDRVRHRMNRLRQSA